MRNLVVTTLSAIVLIALPTLARADDRGAAAGAATEEPPQARRVVRLARRLAQGWAVWPVGLQPARTATA